MSNNNRVLHEIQDLYDDFREFCRNRSWKKKILTVIMTVSCLYVLVDVLFLHHIATVIQKYYYENNNNNNDNTHVMRGTCSYILLLIVAALIMIPPVPLLFMGGYLYSSTATTRHWGIAMAFMASLAGCSIGAVLAFLRSRYMMHDVVALFAKRYRIIRAIHRALSSSHGFRVFLLLRLCPVVPFNSLNHIAGSTDIPLPQFVLSLIGIVPTTLLTVVAGATAEQMVYAGAEEDNEDVETVYTVSIVLTVAGLLGCVGAVVGTAYVARHELRNELEGERLVALAEGRRNSRSCSDQASSVMGITTTTHDSIDVLDFWYRPMEDVEMTADGYRLYSDGTRVKDCQDEDWFWLFP